MSEQSQPENNPFTPRGYDAIPIIGMGTYTARTMYHMIKNREEIRQAELNEVELLKDLGCLFVVGFYQVSTLPFLMVAQEGLEKLV